MTAQQNQEIKLLEVSVEGNILTSENTILFTSGLRKGLTITATEFQRAIKRLWNLGLFQNIQLRYDDESPEGLTITIIVKENPILGALHFEGNKKIKNKKFDEELDFILGQRIRPNTLHETSKKIKQLYAEKGYLQADVSTRMIKPEETSTLYGGKAKDLVKDVIFTIEENGKVKIGNIIFEGNHAFTDLRLRLKMKETKRQRWYLFWRSTFDEKKYNEDLDQIQTFYRNKGYRDFKILKDTIQFNPDRRRLDLVVSVDEGPQYKYRNFTWEGYTLFNKQVLSRALAIQKGDRYSEEDFNL
ncbi:MAG: POTRA domain-containing protein, partial [Candidatus Neomarinimicrobiota bacterium]|nr:POTRA domain-containing protein [Candidatus Neomarinimicrobiota bacterium]